MGNYREAAAIPYRHGMTARTAEKLQRRQISFMPAGGPSQTNIGGIRDMRAARYIITIAYDDGEPTTVTKLADDGTAVTLIVARTFEEATALYQKVAADQNT